MTTKLASDQQNASPVGLPPSVTVTHPNHPLHGQMLEVVGVPRSSNTKLLVRHLDGRCFRIPRGWTDFEVPQDDRTELADSHLLDIKGLCKAAEIIKLIKSNKCS